MICKHCGAEITASSGKCKRCGTRIPAKSDCGGFYDLASAGKKMWADAQAAEPIAAPSRSATPTVKVVKGTRTVMIYQIIALALVAALLLALIPMGIAISRRNQRIDELEASLLPTGNGNEVPAPDAPPLADHATFIHMQLDEDGNLTVSSNISSQTTKSDGSWTSPLLPQANEPVKVTWEWSLIDPEAPAAPETDDGEVSDDVFDNQSGSTTVTEAQANKWHRLTVTITPDAAIFGEAAEEPICTWHYRVKGSDEFWTILTADGIIADGNTLTCNPDILGDTLDQYEFRLTFQQSSTANGMLKIAIGSFTCPVSEADIPDHAAPKDDNTDGKLNANDQ